MIQAGRHSRRIFSPRRPAHRRPMVTLPSNQPNMLPIEAAAAPLATPLASLLTRHQLRDGEVILLVLKPSVWFILLVSLRFVAAVMIAAIAARLWLHANTHFCMDGTVFCIAGRLMFATAAWFGRLYVLTDQRVLRITGVLNVEICDCPLRKSHGPASFGPSGKSSSASARSKSFPRKSNGNVPCGKPSPGRSRSTND